MTARRTPSDATRSIFSLACIVVGALLLLLVPLLLIVQAFLSVQDVELPGTLVILTVVGGMGLVVLGLAFRA